MRLKLAFLVLFTAIVSSACVSYERGVSRGIMQPRLGANNFANTFVPITIQRTDRVAGGKCLAKLSYDASGDLKVETEPPCIVGQGPLFVNGEELQDSDGLITFGSGTTTCYPTSPPRCICTKSPCP